MRNNNYVGIEDFHASVDKEIKQKKRVKGLTNAQAKYLDAINTSIVTFCIGPAGSGKTFIAVARAMELLLDNAFKRIVVSRPIMECDEKLGYLPGDVDEKITPYMRPIDDAFMDVADSKVINEYKENEIIEYCPLAYMRGRTINNSIMILDEAQNATYKQIVMFLTRIGQNSKIIISGDVAQKDQYDNAYEKIVNEFDSPPYIDGVNVVKLTDKDIVRNDIIQKILSKLGQY